MINAFMGYVLIKIHRIEQSIKDVIASQVTNISPQQQCLDVLLNLYKNDIVSFNGELLDKKECPLKGAQYTIHTQVRDDTGLHEIDWSLRYLKLVGIDTRDSLEKILHQLRSSNPKGVDKLIISNTNPKEEEPGQIFKDGFIRYSCFEKFNDLKEGFQLAFFVSDNERNYFDALVFEDIIVSLLELDELKEESFKIVEGELIENQLKLSTILREEADFMDSIVGNSILKESNWTSTINYKNSGDLYLTSPRVNFKVIDKKPPSYNESTSF